MAPTNEENYTDSEDTITYKPPEGDACYINVLSDDILVEIFKLVYAFWPTKEHKQRFEIRVCQRWRSLIIDTPLLWTRIYIPNAYLSIGPLYDNEHSLERSKGALLDLVIVDNSDEVHQEGAKIHSVLVEHHSRIRRLSVLAGSEVAIACVLANWKSEDTPHLTTMHLNSAYWAFTPRNPGYESRWFGARGMVSVPTWPGLPNLRTLILDYFDVRRFPASSNLRVLQLGAVELTAEGLQGILDQFPALETLTIQDLLALTGSRARAAVPDGTVIRAPSLRKLAIGSFRRHRSKCMCGLAYLAAPNLEYLELQCEPSLLTQRHFSVLFHSDNTQNLGKIRLGYRTALLLDGAVEFLRGLPRQERIDLEASWFVGPLGRRRDVRVLLEATTGMRSITVDFGFARAFGWTTPKNPDAAELIGVVRNAETCTPAFVRGLTHGGDEMSYQGADEALLGSGIKLLRSPVPDWLVEKWNSLFVNPYDDFKLDKGDESDEL